MLSISLNEGSDYSLSTYSLAKAEYSRISEVSYVFLEQEFGYLTLKMLTHVPSDHSLGCLLVTESGQDVAFLPAFVDNTTMVQCLDS